MISQIFPLSKYTQIIDTQIRINKQNPEQCQILETFWGAYLFPTLDLPKYYYTDS